jgi:uncharacterized membrane protein YcjF (UPF0283 family)
MRVISFCTNKKKKLSRVYKIILKKTLIFNSVTELFVLDYIVKTWTKSNWLYWIISKSVLNYVYRKMNISSCFELSQEKSVLLG